jgi:hypothetical protein
MSIRNQNWYNLQSTRSYPLDEGGTLVDAAGVFVRNDIIVDCYLRFPSAFGEQMYVQGITVSAGLVTVLLGVTDGTTVAVVSEPKPVTPYINYAVTGLVPGISGWIVFGPGIVENFSGRYTSVAQTAIQTRCARPYRALPIPTIGKLGITTSLDGVVNLTASTPVTAKYETITTAGATHRAIVLRLDNSQISTTYNPLTEFLGPCGQRPESGTCPKTPIETINGITPDCAGNIDIEFAGFTAKNFTTCGGLDVLTTIGLADVCAANEPKKPQDFVDNCCNPNSPVFDGITEYCWPDPSTNIDLVVDQTTFKPNYNCLLLPLCLDFGSCDPSPYFEIRNGVFVSAKTDAPPLCACGDFSSIDETSLSKHYTYVTTGTGTKNIAVLRNCPTDWAVGKTVTTQLKIGTNGVERNGGLVLGYKQAPVNGVSVVTYFVVLIDVSRAKLRVLRYNNSKFIEETSTTVKFTVKNWYTLDVATTYNTLNPSQLNLTFTVTETHTNTAVITGSTPIAAADYVDGFYGLFANRSYTFFNKFKVS